MLNTKQKIEHLRKLGFNGDFEQIERMYCLLYTSDAADEL